MNLLLLLPPLEVQRSRGGRRVMVGTGRRRRRFVGRVGWGFGRRRGCA